MDCDRDVGNEAWRRRGGHVRPAEPESHKMVYRSTSLLHYIYTTVPGSTALVQLLVNLLVRHLLEQAQLVRDIFQYAEDMRVAAVSGSLPVYAAPHSPLEPAVFAVQDLLLLAVLLDEQTGFAQLMPRQAGEQMVRDLQVQTTMNELDLF